MSARYTATCAAAPGVYILNDRESGVLGTIVAQRAVADAFARLLNDRPELDARRSNVASV